jgi:glycosyltransferase involved in cell wall biosynthesis
MRILMLSQFYAPIIGGEEQHVRNLSHKLAARGHHVAVATLHQRGLPQTELDGAVRLYRVPSLTQRAAWLYSDAERAHAAPLPDPETVLGLKAVVEREQPDIVHAHNWLLHAYLPLRMFSRRPFVVTLHDYSLACATKRLVRQGQPCTGPGLSKCLACAAQHYGPAKGALTTVANWTMGTAEARLVDMFLAVSDATALGNQLKARGLRYRVLPNFVPDDVNNLAEPYDAGLIEQLPERFMLFVGDLSHEKGVDVIVRAYAQLAGAPPLVLIGRRCPDTPDELPPNVFMFYKWPHGTIMEAWRRCLFGLAPSTWEEPFGAVAVEAMAAGRAVIVSDIGGLRDLVAHEQTGLLVKPNDAISLRQAMQRLLADPLLTQELGQRGQRLVGRFMANAVVPEIEAVYRELLDPSGKRAATAPETAADPTRQARDV